MNTNKLSQKTSGVKGNIGESTMSCGEDRRHIASMQESNTNGTEELQDLLTPEMAAKLLCVNLKTVHRLVRERRLPCVQISPKKRRFTLPQLRGFIEQRTIPTHPGIDKGSRREVSSAPKLHKGGDRLKTTGNLVRTQLREEMRSWQ
jgi:excisionase family DNA binding protein